MVGDKAIRCTQLALVCLIALETISSQIAKNSAEKQTYLIDCKDLAVALLNLLQLSQEIPEHT